MLWETVQHVYCIMKVTLDTCESNSMLLVTVQDARNLPDICVWDNCNPVDVHYVYDIHALYEVHDVHDIHAVCEVHYVYVVHDVCESPRNL